MKNSEIKALLESLDKYCLYNDLEYYNLAGRFCNIVESTNVLPLNTKSLSKEQVKNMVDGKLYSEKKTPIEKANDKKPLDKDLNSAIQAINKDPNETEEEKAENISNILAMEESYYIDESLLDEVNDRLLKPYDFYWANEEPEPETREPINYDALDLCKLEVDELRNILETAPEGSTISHIYDNYWYRKAEEKGQVPKQSAVEKIRSVKQNYNAPIATKYHDEYWQIAGREKCISDMMSIIYNRNNYYFVTDPVKNGSIYDKINNLDESLNQPTVQEVVDAFANILSSQGLFQNDGRSFTFDDEYYTFHDPDDEVEYQIRGGHEMPNDPFKSILVRFTDDITHTYRELYLSEFEDIYDLIYYALSDELLEEMTDKINQRVFQQSNNLKESLLDEATLIQISKS